MRVLLLIVAALLLASPTFATEVEARAGLGLGGIAVTGYATEDNTPTGQLFVDYRTGLPRELGQTWFTVSPSLAGLIVFQPWESLDVRVGFALGDAAYPTFSRDVSRWGVINATTIAGVLRLGQVGFEIGGGLDEVLLRACNPNGCRRETALAPGADLKMMAEAKNRWTVGAHLHGTWFNSWTTGPTRSFTAVLRVEYRLGG